MTQEELRELVKNTIVEINDLDESDLVARDPDHWERMKNDFKKNVITLIQNIEDDNYSDAHDTIGETIGMLKFWRAKIKKGLDTFDMNAGPASSSVLGEED